MITTLITVWLLYVGAMISPGPNILLVTQLAAGNQRRSAVYAGVGVAVGAGLWASCVVLGINLIFEAFPWLRLLLGIAGGSYLLYVAWTMWRVSATTVEGIVAPVSAAIAFRRGLLTNITNPKAALFFGSVFATSFPADPSAGLQIATVTVVVLSAFSWYMLLAYLFSRRSVRAGYARGRRTANRVSATLFGVIGASLLLASFRNAKA